MSNLPGVPRLCCSLRSEGNVERSRAARQCQTSKTRVRIYTRNSDRTPRTGRLASRRARAVRAKCRLAGLTNNKEERREEERREEERTGLDKTEEDRRREESIGEWKRVKEGRARRGELVARGDARSRGPERRGNRRRGRRGEEGREEEKRGQDWTRQKRTGDERRVLENGRELRREELEEES